MKLQRFLSAILIAAFLTACGCSDPAHAAQNATSINFLLSQVRASGTVLAGGKVYFYAAGTSTPKTVWLNRSKQTAAANPYTLDANGTAQLYGDGIYRIVIKDTAGVTKYDRDNQAFKDPAGYAYDLAEYASLNAAVAAIGSTPATIQYAADTTLTGHLTIPANIELQPINGAKINLGGYVLYCPQWQTGRWPQAQMFTGNGTVTGLTDAIPQWWGAKGDGATDDTSAVNKALAASKSVYLPVTAASYVVDGNTGLILFSGSTLYSNGAWVKLKAGSYGSTAYLINTAPGQDGSYNAGLAVVEKVTVKGINFDGNMANVAGSATGINLYKVLEARVSDCYIKNLPGAVGGGYGIISWYSNNVWITRVKIDRTDRQNIAIWETKGAHIDQCDLNYSETRDNILVSSNTLTDDGGITHYPSYQTSYATITNTKCVNTSASGTHVIRFSGGSSGVVENCELTSNGTKQGVYIVDVLHHTVRISKCTITSCSYGVEVASDTDANQEAKYVSIVDNKIIGCEYGIKYNTNGTVNVIGNRILNTVNQPLLLAFCPDKVVTGNIIDGGNTYVSIRAELGGTTIFANNTITGLTHATLGLFVIGEVSANPIITGNVVEGNTANVISCTVGGTIFGNSVTTVTASVAKVTAFNGIRQVYGTSTPSSGTWGINDRIIRQPAVAGQPKAWVCTVAGTSGTLNGGATTANTTATSSTIVVSSVTGLAVGNYITVAGIGGTTTKRVTAIDGLNVTIDTAATNTVAAGAVSFVNPTFVSEGNL